MPPGCHGIRPKADGPCHLVFKILELSVLCERVLFVKMHPFSTGPSLDTIFFFVAQYVLWSYEMIEHEIQTCRFVKHIGQCEREGTPAAIASEAVA